MAIDKLEKSDDEKAEMDLTLEGVLIKELFTKVDESLDMTNTHISELTTEKNKTGITSGQASAITANTAKVTLGATNANSLSFVYNTKTGNLDITVVVSSKLTKRATITLK